MKNPTRIQALRRIKSDPQIVKLIQKYPELKAIINSTRAYKADDESYNRVRVYFQYKARVLELMPEPDAAKIYLLIGDLLPLE